MVPFIYLTRGFYKLHGLFVIVKRHRRIKRNGLQRAVDVRHVPVVLLDIHLLAVFVYHVSFADVRRHLRSRYGDEQLGFAVFKIFRLMDER